MEGDARDHGGSEGAWKDQRRFYITARGSALECAAILDALEVLDLAAQPQLREPRELLVRIVSMLTRMIQLEAV